jgi:hypothetical protein
MPELSLRVQPVPLSEGDPNMPFLFQAGMGVVLGGYKS